ncbi:MAG TPA: HAMP domain-containing sensor histidine kinase [Gaiellaceae bacterium]|jgi:signal transduction histidine kinase|nr:HAMP domain-containing sensor histidine kinase [Gaiellaceae bacterium]
MSNPLRSVGARLGLGLAVVVAAALLLVDLIVVPSLERNLVRAKIAQLREVAPGIGTQLLNSYPFNIDDTIQEAAQSADARLVYYEPLAYDPPRLRVFADSNAVTAADVENDRLALRAFSQARLVSGTVTSGGVRYAEVAYPVFGGPVVLLRASLHDSLRSIHLVRSRLFIAGLIALAASLAVGYLAASLFARRIRRLERAADRIASGDFGRPVVDTGKDELGQLAAAFERMRQRLAQLEHARREFIANASHELRTPLFSLGGFLELLSDEDLDERTKAEFMATMREQVDRLTKLATELLDLSRLDAGRLSVQREPIDLGELADTLAEEFRAVSRASGHRLTVEGEAARAFADDERTLQIGRILVENALVHTPPGTTVRVGTGQRDGTALLTVEDDGPGIPPEHAGQVFDRFYRVEGSKASGSGLGLAIARELAGLMGGSIELESAGSHTRFVLLLPTLADVSSFSREIEPAGEPSLQ